MLKVCFPQIINIYVICWFNNKLAVCYAKYISLHALSKIVIPQPGSVAFESPFQFLIFSLMFLALFREFNFKSFITIFAVLCPKSPEFFCVLMYMFNRDHILIFIDLIFLFPGSWRSCHKKYYYRYPFHSRCHVKIFSYYIYSLFRSHLMKWDQQIHCKSSQKKIIINNAGGGILGLKYQWALKCIEVKM